MKKLTALITCLIIIASMMGGCANFKGEATFNIITDEPCVDTPITDQPSIDTPITSEWDYQQNFEDIDSVNQDFDAFYLTQFMGMILPEDVALQQPSDVSHWAIKDGEIYRSTDIRPEDGMANYSMLFFTKKRYRNFKMQVDIRQGSQTNYWSTFNIRTEEASRHFFADGEAFYMQSDGALMSWGHGLHGGPYLLSKINDYSQTSWNTYTVTVSGNFMVIQINDQSTICVLPARFYRYGYVSFFSINNDTKIRNFKIKELPDSSAPCNDFPLDPTIPSADTPDSLDKL